MYLLLDFDGTLVDSFDCVMKKAMILSEQFNYRKLDDSEIAGLRELSSNELIKLLKIPIYRIPPLIHHIRKHLRNEMPNLAPANAIRPVIEKLYNEKFSLGIITSNSIENVSIWLESHEMRHFFKFINTESHYFSKRYILNKTIKNYKIDRANTYYICDETRDIEAATKNKIKSIAVTWGYNSEKALLQCNPTFIAKHPNDILKIFDVAADNEH